MEMIVLFLGAAKLWTRISMKSGMKIAEQIKDTSVVIGNHVLVCSKVTILKGVKIGNNVIIAAEFRGYSGMCQMDVLLQETRANYKEKCSLDITHSIKTKCL